MVSYYFLFYCGHTIDKHYFTDYFETQVHNGESLDSLVNIIISISDLDSDTDTGVKTETDCTADWVGGEAFASKAPPVEDTDLFLKYLMRYINDIRKGIRQRG